MSEFEFLSEKTCSSCAYNNKWHCSVLKRFITYEINLNSTDCKDWKMDFDVFCELVEVAKKKRKGKK